MKDLLFDQEAVAQIPQNRRVKVVAAVVFHVLLVVLIVTVKTRPVRMSSAGITQVGIEAYIPGPVGTAGTSTPKPAAPVQPKKTMAATVAKNVPQEKPDQSDAGAGSPAAAAGAAGSGQGTGPVRLGSGGNLTLLNKVTPVYPPVMQSARMPGQVVLDAIIHSDGTIGDVKVLR